jgi:hypothetical protein
MFHYDILNHWSPQQALAVYDFLGDIQEWIWERCQLELLELMAPTWKSLITIS